METLTLVTIPCSSLARALAAAQAAASSLPGLELFAGRLTPALAGKASLASTNLLAAGELGVVADALLDELTARCGPATEGAPPPGREPDVSVELATVRSCVRLRVRTRDSFFALVLFSAGDVQLDLGVCSSRVKLEADDDVSIALTRGADRLCQVIEAISYLRDALVTIANDWPAEPS